MDAAPENRNRSVSGKKSTARSRSFTTIIIKIPHLSRIWLFWNAHHELFEMNQDRSTFCVQFFAFEIVQYVQWVSKSNRIWNFVFEYFFLKPASVKEFFLILSLSVRGICYFRGWHDLRYLSGYLDSYNSEKNRRLRCGLLEYADIAVNILKRDVLCFCDVDYLYSFILNYFFYC